jgi:predicted Zn-ribbon and HTH transcriptional regulator
VPAVQFFLCNGCGTVYADIEKPPACHRCESKRIEQLRAEDQAFNYFTGTE